MNECENLSILLENAELQEDTSLDGFVSDFEKYEKEMGISRSKKELVISMQEYRNLVYSNMMINRKL